MSTDRPDSGTSDTGISTLDLMGMSVPIRRIVRIMLRKPRLTYEELCEAIDDLPEEKRPSREDLEKALKELVEMEWLIRSEEGKAVSYQVRIKKKEGSDVSRSSRKRDVPSTMKKLWDTVESDKTVAQEGEKAQREMSKLHHEEMRRAAHPDPLGALPGDEPALGDVSKGGEKKETEKKKPERRRRCNLLDALKPGGKDEE